MAVKGGDKQAIQKVAAEIVAGDESDYCWQTRDVAAIMQAEHDYIAITYPTATTEVYTYKTGGSSGTTVATVTLTYTDSTKANLSSVART